VYVSVYAGGWSLWANSNAMNAKQLYQAGRLADAIAALSGEVRQNPGDTQRRAFLFELLALAGDYDRAERQLQALPQGDSSMDLWVLVGRAALAAERKRQEMFARGEYPPIPASEPPALSGEVNGRPFQSLEDADARFGVKLELIAAGRYMWLPLEHVAAIRIEPPRRLRDLLWLPAQLRTGPAFRDLELGEVLLPVLYPLSWRHADEAVRLGRATVWEEQEDGAVTPFGQRILLVDGEELPILEVRDLRIQPPAAEPA
jgi:type VI secretion system protein ImpE